MSNLTTRQWDLYNLIKEESINNPDKWVNNYEIFEKVAGYKPKDSDTPLSASAVKIRNDIRAIKDDETIQKIVISSRLGYRLATEEEASEYLRKEKIKCLMKLKRYYNQVEKANKDGYVRLVEDGSKARQVIEAFID